MKSGIKGVLLIIASTQFWILFSVHALGKSPLNEEPDKPVSEKHFEETRLQLTRPNGGENWLAGSRQSIRWKSTQTIGNISIQYSSDNKESWHIISNNVSNSGRYDFIAPDIESDSVFVKIQAAKNDSIYDISDSSFSIFWREQFPRKSCIPRPMTLTIDDIGWKLGQDDSYKNGPYRLGTNRNPVFRDYETLVYVAKNVGIRLSGRFILSEFDRDNILANYPSTNEYGNKWDNSSLISDDDFRIMNFLKENSTWLELGIHGVRHEYWDWENENGKMVRTEFYDEIHNKPWPFDILKNHLLAFQSILAQYAIDSFPESYTTPGNGYYYRPDSDNDSGALFHSFGVKYAITDMIQAGNYGMSKQAIISGGVIDNGVLLIQQSRNVDNWPKWNAIGAPPTNILPYGIPITHWPNWWAQKPDDDFRVGDEFITWFHYIESKADIYVSRNIAQYYSQWLYRKYSEAQHIGNEFILDNRNMPDDVYQYHLLGNLVLKIELPSNRHIQKISIDNDAEIVGYFEKGSFAFIFLSMLKQKIYHLSYEFGLERPPVYIWNDGTYNIQSFKTLPNAVYAQLELYGQQDVKIKMPFRPHFVTVMGDLTLLGYNYDEANHEVSVTLKNSLIVGQMGILIVGRNQLERCAAVLSPHGGEKWKQNSMHRIIWCDSDSLDNVVLEYSPDYGATWCTIASNLPNAGDYAWQVPYFLSHTYLVRIRNMADGRVLAKSDSSFSIIKSDDELSSRDPLINEVETNNHSTIQDGENNYSSWVEIYNPNNFPINLAGCFLSDDSLNLEKWRFPCVNVNPKGYAIIWTSGKGDIINNGSYTNFSIDTCGGHIYLSNPNGKLIDSLKVPSLNADISYSRIPDGGTSFRKTAQPTPGQENIFKEPQVVFDGFVRYYSNEKPIRNVTLNIKKDGNIFSVNKINGTFQLTFCTAGSVYTFIPNKDARNANHSMIIMYDAALAARYSVGLDTLSPFQIRVADVSGDKFVTMYDASIIAKYSVGLAIPGNAQVGKWKFWPDSLVFKNIQTINDSANFMGYIVGDIVGNWGNYSRANMTKFANLKKIENNVEISNDTLILNLPPICRENKVLSIDFDMSYSIKQLKFLSVERCAVTKNFKIFLNTKSARIRFGAFNLHKINAKSTLFRVKFYLLNKNTDAIHLTINTYKINENLLFYGKLNVKMYNNVTMGFNLLQNYPNPFNAETKIVYSVPESENITLTIFNSMGQGILSFVRKNEKAGRHQIFWNGRNKYGQKLPSGVYFIEIRGKNFRKLTKAILLN